MWNGQELEMLFEAIFHRKSIRKFKEKSLDTSTLVDIEAQLNKLKPIFPEEKTAFRLLNSDQVKGRGTGNTHHLAIYAEQGLKSYTNAGFMLQQMDLWCSAKGIGSWWHGLAQPIKDYDTVDSLPFAFLITIGIADESIHRNPGDYKRKPLGEITDVKGEDVLLEAVRFAPSAMNRQPWFISTSNNNRMVFFNEKNNPMITAIYRYITYLDAGIGLCHLWLAAEHEGKHLMFTHEEGRKNRSKKSEYICTIK